MAKRSSEFYRAVHDKTKDCTTDEFKSIAAKIDDSAEMARALRDRGYACNAAEFKELLVKFGGNSAYLAALQKAVDDLSKVEERGNAWEDGTPGWNTFVKKRNMIRDCRLGVGDFKDMFNEAVEPKAEELPILERIMDRLEQLSARLDALEGKPQPPSSKR